MDKPICAGDMGTLSLLRGWGGAGMDILQEVGRVGEVDKSGGEAIPGRGNSVNNGTEAQQGMAQSC